MKTKLIYSIAGVDEDRDINDIPLLQKHETKSNNDIDSIRQVVYSAISILAARNVSLNDITEYTEEILRLKKELLKSLS